MVAKAVTEMMAILMQNMTKGIMIRPHLLVGPFQTKRSFGVVVVTSLTEPACSMMLEVAGVVDDPDLLSKTWRLFAVSFALGDIFCDLWLRSDEVMLEMSEELKRLKVSDRGSKVLLHEEVVRDLVAKFHVVA